MISKDYDMLISQMEKRIELLEKEFATSKVKPDFNDQDWDNATLMQEWKISERTSANYRKNGLKYYKLGGRVYYMAEARKAFQKQIKTKN